MTHKILVSACLLGHRVRYHGGDKKIVDADFDWLFKTQELVPLCPEVAADLPVPRPPAEIQSGDGAAVLDGTTRVVTEQGDDLTDAFVSAAQIALKRCQEEQIEYAVLTDFSPSCGSSEIYAGNFDSSRIRGSGVTAALLQANGIQVFNQTQVADLRKQLESTRL